MSGNDCQTATILARDGQGVFTVADVRFEESSRAFLGRMLSSNTTPELAALLDDLEDLVEGQSFAYVDEVQDKIDDFGLIAKFSDGPAVKIVDLFISESGGASFRRRL